jgi:CheY-like chemotaxis protein
MRRPRPPSRARPILVVDDDAGLRRRRCGALTDAGDAVVAAPAGAVALARVREAAPDLILLDLRLPGMDGWAFARRSRAPAPPPPGPRAPLVCVTAAVDPAARGAQIGAATTGKPFDLAALLAVVERYALPSPDSGRGRRRRRGTWSSEAPALLGGGVPWRDPG